MHSRPEGFPRRRLHRLWMARLLMARPGTPRPKSLGRAASWAVEVLLRGASRYRRMVRSLHRLDSHLPRLSAPDFLQARTEHLGEELFRTAFENAPIGMALVGLDGFFLHVNAALCALTGYSRRELLRRTFQDITHPEDLAQDLENVQRLLEGRISTYQLHKRYHHARGHVVSAQLTCSLVKDPLGEPLYMIAQIQDVSERERLERAWRFLADAGPRLADSLEPRATLAAVAQLAVPALAELCVVELIDEEGRVRLADWRAATEEQSRRLGALASTVPHEPLRQGVLIAQVLRTGRPLLLAEVPDEVLGATAVDARHLSLLHALQPLSVIAVPLLTRGRTLGVLVLMTTLTGRRFTERDLGLAEELAHRAALALDNAALHEKSALALHVRDEVLRVVAHDLRAPLQVIGLSSELLLRRAAQEDAQDLVPIGTIRKAVERANRLIQDLLDVARLEEGHLPVVHGPQPTAALVEEAAELHRALAREKSIGLTVEVAEDAPAVLADRDRVLQIFSNLLGNAVKFTPQGGHIHLRAERAGDMMRFRVTDSGPGIAEADLPHLFEPFWQARNGQEHKQGAGLGLAIVRGLVAAHGGILGVESAPGRGSTFSFTLPCVPASDAPREPLPSPGP